ncbi:AAA family ATPase [Pseudomonas extremaustralis]|uniref:AAA family ATPase n=1 Tax=Pseudomonas extremaustralis TaxID=359110 RepID=UPI00285459EF|nr:AAA family ATPase [Pseudomonas extremaustralis]MDR6581025.1 putative ATPase [Pseudomonas extremaustralis]
MRFQINEVQADGHWVPLTDYRASDNYENIFTLIVGQNAVGKSRLLRKIVSNYIFSQESRTKSSIKSGNYYNQDHSSLWNQSHNAPKQINYFALPSKAASYDSHLFRDHNYYLGEVRTSLTSSLSPSNVIAVSTGRHDRFPSATHIRNKEIIADYRYIGTDQFSKNSISSSLISLLEGLLQGRQSLHKLSDIFEYLGFAPYLDIKLSLDRKQYSRLTTEELNELHYSSNQSLLEFLIGDDSHVHDNYSSASAFYEYLKSRSKTNIELGFWDHSLDMKHRTITELIPFLKSGLIKIFDITLISLINKSRMRLSQASSGQQCMLTIMLGIAGAIKDGSLICIDEPEISLHPQWQTNLVKQLQEVFSNFSGCHFVIATHSPQLVSGLTSNNGYVLNLEEKELYHSFEYAKRSADFQLAEVFHTPGQNNEYLLRVTLLLLTKLSRREELNYDDRETFKMLLSIRKNMSDADPVYHLIGQVEALH